ncbi:hypothetical protein [Achromobacter spanius]|uniref:hypothetical protein n=1 Tax=Achromobacter spanius TaxID=217203 RepID=UPI003A8CB860
MPLKPAADASSARRELNAVVEQETVPSFEPDQAVASLAPGGAACAPITITGFAVRFSSLCHDFRCQYRRL